MLDFSLFSNLISEVTCIFIFESPSLSQFWAALQILSAIWSPIQGQSQARSLFWPRAGVSDSASPLFAFLKSISPQLWCYRNLAGFKEILTAHLPSLCHSGLVTHSSSPALDPSLWSFDFMPHWFGFPIFPLQLLAINIRALSPRKSRLVITTVIFKGLLTLVIFPQSGTFPCVLFKLGLLTHLQFFLLLWKSYVP